MAVASACRVSACPGVRVARVVFRRVSLVAAGRVVSCRVVSQVVFFACRVLLRPC